MHADIAPVTASIAKQLPRFSLHAQQTGTTLPPLAVPFLLSYRTNNLELKTRSNNLAHFVYVDESANSRIDNKKSIEKTLEKEKPRMPHLKKRLKNLAPRFARWHASNWNGQTDKRTVSVETQTAVPDGGLPRHWRLLSLPGHSPKYEKSSCLSNLLTPILECLLTTAGVAKNHTDLSRANCFVVADESPGSSSIVHEPRKPSLAHIGPQNSQTSLCDRCNSLSLRLIGQFAKQSVGVFFSCLEIKYIKHDYIADGTCNMSELHAVFRAVISTQFVFDTHEFR
ncbi:hypothetical protein ALC57_14368 [Trachymyrmex cornetzi]|uniref:Uncharacterized protein n=1 Tax=Trachymyrmex cornetzi TaxID=471704 RepID=A0A195DKD2_9HYME|nr:hypothetical protein ALC57_14368 [Trachymyrmex cornetzi]